MCTSQDSVYYCGQCVLSRVVCTIGTVCTIYDSVYYWDSVYYLEQCVLLRIVCTLHCTIVDSVYY